MPFVRDFEASNEAFLTKYSGVKDFKWKKGELLGEGAYGKVYAALNEENGELMAVKEIRAPAQLCPGVWANNGPCSSSKIEKNDHRIQVRMRRAEMGIETRFLNQCFLSFFSRYSY